MNSLSQTRLIKQHWSQSKRFRIALILTTLYALLRLAAHFAFLVLPMDESGTPMLPDDLRIYLDAARDFGAQMDLYPSTVNRWEFFQYAPTFALAFIPFRWLPDTTVAVIHTLLHIIFYFLLYQRWDRIFKAVNLNSMRITLAQTLPIWIVFAAFWADLGYLNVYILTALLASLLIDTLMQEDLGKSLLWLSIILQFKPQWAFAAVVPLLIGKRRFFFQLVGLAGLIYVVVAAATTVVAGPVYGWKQYQDYFQLLANLLNRTYPWRTLDDGFLGYNHSITQIVVYLVGISPTAFRIATTLKLVLLVPLGLTSLRFLSRPPNDTSQDAHLFLELAFAFYLAVFIWLDAVWELSLGIAVYVFLMGTLTNSKTKTFNQVVFLVYALIDVWQFANFIVLGPLVVVPGPYVLADPSIYLPIIMIVTLTFYALLVKRLGKRFNSFKLVT